MDGPLATYLNDHLAGAQFAIAMLQRMRDAHPDESLHQFASKLLAEIESDRAILQKLADEVGGNTNALKEATAWLTEKASRLKLRLGDGDELAEFEALETLALGILGKLKLWQSLATVVDRHPPLQRLKLGELADRAQSQHAQVESRRLAAARKLFGS
jgi:hypothetical protein